MTRPPVVGLFVGGRATRMGGVVKGLLPAPDTGEPLVVRLARICREALPEVEVVLVGAGTAYDAIGIPSVADDPTGVGPLGGLAALCRRALERQTDAIAVAGDLPYVTSPLVMRIGTEHAARQALAPRLSGVWQPLFARYTAAPCLAIAERLIAQDRRALHGVLDALGDRAGVLELASSEVRLLDDWDTPEAVQERKS